MSPEHAPLASPDALGRLESHLSRTLRPVQMPHGLAAYLRQRAAQSRAPAVELRLGRAGQVLKVLGGVLGLAALLITGVRALYYFFARNRQ